MRVPHQRKIPRSSGPARGAFAIAGQRVPQEGGLPRFGSSAPNGATTATTKEARRIQSTADAVRQAGPKPSYRLSRGRRVCVGDPKGPLFRTLVIRLSGYPRRSVVSDDEIQ